MYGKLITFLYWFLWGLGCLLVFSVAAQIAWGQAEPTRQPHKFLDAPNIALWSMTAALQVGDLVLTERRLNSGQFTDAAAEAAARDEQREIIKRYLIR